MKHDVFSVFDNAVKAYLPPFFVRSHGEAIRNFEGACQQPDHQFFKHAKDYSLFYLGEYDDATGQFANAQAPTLILTALKAQQPASPGVVPR